MVTIIEKFTTVNLCVAWCRSYLTTCMIPRQIATGLYLFTGLSRYQLAKLKGFWLTNNLNALFPFPFFIGKGLYWGLLAQKQCYMIFLSHSFSQLTSIQIIISGKKRM